MHRVNPKLNKQNNKKQQKNPYESISIVSFHTFFVKEALCRLIEIERSGRLKKFGLILNQIWRSLNRFAISSSTNYYDYRDIIRSGGGCIKVDLSVINEKEYRTVVFGPVNE